MAIFAVYCPKDLTPDEAPEALRFVAERPSFWAFVAPPVWLAARGLWLGLVFWLAAAAALYALTRGMAAEPAGIIIGLSWLWFAFAARDLEQASLVRAGWTLEAVIEGASRAAAERHYFNLAAAEVTGVGPFAEPSAGRRSDAGVIGFEGFGDARR